MIKVRKYGTGHQKVILLHGGPGAAGYLDSLGRELGADFEVFEPFQRGSYDVPLTVDTHLEDLHALVLGCCEDYLPVLVGHSWGAMLALAYAAKYSSTITSAILVGCGTFSVQARAKFLQSINVRLSPSQKARLEQLDTSIMDIDQRFAAKGHLFSEVFSYDPFADIQVGEYDFRAHEETWNDMLHQQEEGIFPDGFVDIEVPVCMLHGDYDPHPGQMIYSDLKPFIPQLEYVELKQCGHNPWIERHAHTKFYSILRQKLMHR